MDILDEIWKARHPKDALFLSIIEGYTIKESKEYPDRLFYTKGESVLIDYELKTKVTWINYELIWSVFQSKFYLNYIETKELLRVMLETHLKLKRTTPSLTSLLNSSGLETHLKLKRTTPKFDRNNTYPRLHNKDTIIGDTSQIKGNNNRKIL